MTIADGRLEALTNDGLLRRNVVLNLLGWSLPALAALISLPLLARGLGPARFGLVALTWSAVGIFSLFDFGLGRALTRVVAERLAVGDEEEIHDLVWAASWLLLGGMGIMAVIGFFASPAIVDRFLHVPAALRSEAVGSVRLLALSLPALAHGVALRGVLEAGQRFRLVNALRVPLGIVTYAGPLIAIPLGKDARIAIGTIVFGRVVNWMAHFFVLNDIAPHLTRPRRVKRHAVRELARVGGWITVSQMISPIIVLADRLVVAASFPIAVSGYYGTAAEVANKQWLFTGALQPVFFSAMSAALRPMPGRAAELMERAEKITLLVLLPVAAVLAAFAEPLMHLWMRQAYSAEAATVLRWMAVAVYVNAAAQVPMSMLQGGVNAKSPALLQIVELPIYLGMLLVMARVWGLEGVAIAWLGRMTIDSLGMWWLLLRDFPAGRPVAWRVARLAAPCLVVLSISVVFGLLRQP